ncbi:4'-phosphopantetheinyl transferase [Phaeobacter sp. B1627]|uniref:4'-phosphopantetheinyl transferase family protein n=1 Tax=Phaeobacter sp. B1627 TaxID=2583809 RepID=UPI0011196478|nr:4'-phosphopantetheinyl transferase superfamily protein [Phaeobacter sp. B1627]TNJ42069.1 4'-phosphopantetheinyl transferase superfamily protein [Phaeobacter sp. B1627]
MMPPPSSAPEFTQTTVRLGLLRPLLPETVASAAEDPQGTPPAPFAEEAACLSPQAVEKRRREFAAGRAAAHQAMRALNLTPAPILIGPKRAPVWPRGVVGSITHCRSCALAAIAPDHRFLGLGLDVEEDTPLASDLWPSIASAREQDWMTSQADPGRAGKLLFSAKEAAYKAQYARSQKYFGFDGMELSMDTGTGTFRATFTSDQFPYRGGDQLHGRFAIGAGVIITAVTIPKDAPEP